MKKLFSIAFINFFLFAGIYAQNSEIVYIRTQEPFKTTGSAYAAYMLTTKPDNATENIPLKRLGIDGEFAAENSVLIKNEISKWLNKGFKIVSITSSGGDMISKTTIFLKKDD